MHTVKEIKRGWKAKVKVELALTESMAKFFYVAVKQNQDQTAWIHYKAKRYFKTWVIKIRSRKTTINTKKLEITFINIYINSPNAHFNLVLGLVCILLLQRRIYPFSLFVFFFTVYMQYKWIHICIYLYHVCLRRGKDHSYMGRK